MVNETNQQRRVSKRVITAKRKLDFIYNDNKIKNVVDKVSKNNNAQVDSDHVEKKNGGKSKNGPKVKKHRVKDDSCKRVNKLINKFVSDGIQVSVNSDDEELDCEDDTLMMRNWTMKMICKMMKLAVLIKISKRILKMSKWWNQLAWIVILLWGLQLVLQMKNK